MAKDRSLGVAGKFASGMVIACSLVYAGMGLCGPKGESAMKDAKSAISSYVAENVAGFETQMRSASSDLENKANSSEEIGVSEMKEYSARLVGYTSRTLGQVGSKLKDYFSRMEFDDQNDSSGDLERGVSGVDKYWYRAHGLTDEEFEIVQAHGKRVGVNPNLMLAIRKAENGSEGLEFGVMHTDRYNEDKGYMKDGIFVLYKDSFEKQAVHCAWTIKRNRERYKAAGAKGDFIDFLWNKYSPRKADPMNENWGGNVGFYFDQFEEKSGNK